MVFWRIIYCLGRNAELPTYYHWLVFQAKASKQTNSNEKYLNGERIPFGHDCKDSNPLLPGTIAFKIVARHKCHRGRAWQGKTAHMVAFRKQKKEKKGTGTRFHLQQPISSKNAPSFHRFEIILLSYKSIIGLIYYLDKSLHDFNYFFVLLKEKPQAPLKGQAH